MSKKFIEIVAEYPATCTDPEFKGKPYFSIRYEENGEKFEGFGTYKPEVLSEYIREYFIGADVVERKKGKWLDDQDPIIVSGTCSCCGWEAILFETDVAGMPYCPNCGAKMDEEKTDGKTD